MSASVGENGHGKRGGGGGGAWEGLYRHKRYAAATAEEHMTIYFVDFINIGMQNTNEYLQKKNPDGIFLPIFLNP